MFIAIIILSVFLVAGIWSIWNAFQSNDVEYGYKYYPPKYTSNRKIDPFGFWLAVSLYSLSVLVCVSMIVFIWNCHVPK